MAPALCALGAILAVIAYNRIGLLNSGFWNDEQETIVVCRMIAAGLRLYDTIFNQHGPLVFAFGLVLERLVHSSVTTYRLLILALQCCMLAAIIFSRQQMKASSRVLGTGFVLMVTLIVLPRVLGQMFVYQTIAGIFIAVSLALLVLPAIRNERVTPAAAGLSGFLLGCLPFFAFTYSVAAAGLVLCSVRRGHWRALACGIAAAVLSSVSFLAAFGSLLGFYVDHLYFNLVIYPKYNVESWGNAPARSMVFAALSLTLLAVWAARLRRIDRATRWRIASFALALVSLLNRGPDFQASPFYFAMLPLSFGAAEWLAMPNRRRRATLAWVAGACLIGCSLFLAFDVRRLRATQMPTHSPFSDLVKRYTSPSDRIISYSFNNFQYVAAERLPAAADFFFLPQQAAYDAHPILGFNYNPCLEIARTRPKFVRLDEWKAWGKYPWETYGGCMDEAVRRNYRHVPNTYIYIREDVWPQVDVGAIPPGA